MVTSALDSSRVQSCQSLERNAGASVDQLTQSFLRDLAFEADDVTWWRPADAAPRAHT